MVKKYYKYEMKSKSTGIKVNVFARNMKEAKKLASKKINNIRARREIKSELAYNRRHGLAIKSKKRNSNPKRRSVFWNM